MKTKRKAGGEESLSCLLNLYQWPQKKKQIRAWRQWSKTNSLRKCGNEDRWKKPKIFSVKLLTTVMEVLRYAHDKNMAIMEDMKMNNGLQVMEMRASESGKRHERIARFIVSALFFTAKTIAVVGIGIMIGLYVA